MLESIFLLDFFVHHIFSEYKDSNAPATRGGARHFYLGGAPEGPVLQQGELSMVCVLQL